MDDAQQYIVQPLGKQDRTAFQCGNDELDRYFLERASRDVRENLAAVFVLLRPDDPRTIVGFYTLSAIQLNGGEVPPDLQKRTGRYKGVGAISIGRLAVSSAHAGKGLGGILLVDALKRSLESTKNVASFAVLVDAKDERAAAFYAKCGFLRLQQNRLFLPTKTISQLFGG